MTTSDTQAAMHDVFRLRYAKALRDIHDALHNLVAGNLAELNAEQKRLLGAVFDEIARMKQEARDAQHDECS